MTTKNCRATNHIDHQSCTKIQKEEEEIFEMNKTVNHTNHKNHMTKKNQSGKSHRPFVSHQHLKRRGRKTCKNINHTYHMNLMPTKNFRAGHFKSQITVTHMNHICRFGPYNEPLTSHQSALLDFKSQNTQITQLVC